MTFGEVYAEYCEKGRSGKAYQTIRKQDSLWKNHLSVKFAERFIDGISVAEVNDYLSHLYYKLVSLKTRNARRTVYMSRKLPDYLLQLQQQRASQSTAMLAQRAQNQTWMKDIDSEMISSLELVNSLPNGKMQTVNSMKYHQPHG